MFTDILGYKVFNKGMEDLLIEILTKEKVNIVSGIFPTIIVSDIGISHFTFQKTAHIKNEGVIFTSKV